MASDRDPRQLRQLWHGQRPWYEIWFAVVIDADRKRAAWIRQTLFVPAQGEDRTTVWAAWFDADARPPTRAAKRFAPIGEARTNDGDALIRLGECWIGENAAHGAVDDQLAWQLSWTGGRAPDRELPAWIPAPTHARSIAHDAHGKGELTIAGEKVKIEGRALAMHLWGRRRVPTLHWIWAPYLGGGALEVTAMSLRDRLAMGLASLRLDPAGVDAADERGPLRGQPATAAHPDGLVTSTVSETRRLVHARAWAEPEAMVGYAYRDTDGRDLMVAQSDIGSAHFETFTRTLPGALWKPTDERRTTGGVAVEIHQRTPLPGVAYIAWDEMHAPALPAAAAPALPDRVAWPALGSIVALAGTYADHLRADGREVDPRRPPNAFAKAAHAFAPDDRSVAVPTPAAVLAALEAREPGLAAQLRARFAIVPAVVDYGGALAVIALDTIDDERLAAGEPQPLGLAVANDLTSRLCEVLGEGMPRPLDYTSVARSFPRFLPTAAQVWAPPGGLAKLPDLTIETKVNNERRQLASTAELIYDLATLVRAARVQLGRPLGRGDVIVTGTPAGIGLKLATLQRRFTRVVVDRLRKAELLVSAYATSAELLRPGDVVEVDAGLAGHVRTRLAY